MKCLVCKRYQAELSLNDIKPNYPCICTSCYWSSDNKFAFFEELLQEHLKVEETMPELKFPTDDQYPIGYNWFAYDSDGSGYFYNEKPYIGYRCWLYDSEYTVAGGTFYCSEPINNWKETLREKPSSQNAIDPNYYKWHPVCEAIKITQEFTTNLGCVINYIWRVASPDARKHDSKEGRIQDLKKAIRHLEFEIERINSEC